MMSEKNASLTLLRGNKGWTWLMGQGGKHEKRDNEGWTWLMKQGKA